MAHILVVDDSAVDRRIVRELLSAEAAWRIIEAKDGQEALRILDRHVAEGPGVDLVLTDLQMPNMDGLELVRHLRQERPSIPIVLMTSQGSEEIAVEALLAGAAHYVPKRIMARQLSEIVGRVLDLSRHQKSFQRLMTHLEQNRHRFVLPNDLAMIGSLVNFLRQEVDRVRVCEEADLFRVAVALEEALLNAYYHGNLEVSSQLREIDPCQFTQLANERLTVAPFRDRLIHVDVVLSRAEARFVIRDEGPGFDPSQLPDPTDPENLARSSGRGVLLMRTFMDELAYNAAGNQVTMVKRGICATPVEMVEGGMP